MKDLKKYNNDEIISMLKDNKISVADFIDSGICPTCFNKENNEILYGNKSDKLLYKDEDVECFLVGNPRANGHVAISTQKHYKDIMECDDETCIKVILFTKKMMCILKDVYELESVYLCTMCDGPMNHFHVQLIPRYSFEKRGSQNFVKPRFEYVEDLDKINKIKKKLKDYKNNKTNDK